MQVVFSGFEAANDDTLMVAWMMWTWVRLFFSVFYEVISLSPLPSGIS